MAGEAMGAGDEELNGVFEPAGVNVLVAVAAAESWAPPEKAAGGREKAAVVLSGV